MQFSCEIDIQLPRKKVIELFDNPSNLVKWQPDLLKFEPVSGTPGQPGAKSRLTYRAGKRQYELLETVTRRDLPDEFSGTYESKMGVSTIRNRFEDRGASTRWQMDIEFVGSGFMKVLSLFMAGAMRKQTHKVVQNFKTFAESGKV